MALQRAPILARLGGSGDVDITAPEIARE